MDLTRSDSNHHRRGAAYVWVLLGLILVAAAGLRFTGLEREGRWCDEYFQTASYQHAPQYAVLNAWTSGQPPLDYLIGWAAVRIDDSLRGMRLPAATFGVLGVALCFFLVRKLSSWQEGAIAAALLAFSPLHWRMSQTARPYTICVAAFILMLWMLARALEQPDRRRLTWFAISACLLSLTRGLAPAAILFAFFLTLGTSYVWVRWRRRQDTGEARISSTRKALGGTWLITTLVGLATAVLLAALVVGARSYTAFSTQAPVQGAAHFRELASQLLANVAVWGSAGPAMFGQGATLVVVFALLGVGVFVTRWNCLPLGTRAICVGALLAGLVYLAAYTVAVPDRLITDRYGLFLAPMIAWLAAAGLMALLRNVGKVLSPPWAVRLGAAGVVAMLLLAGPARSTYAWSRLYFNADWRGCATYLADKVTADDVVIVLQDRALGEYQPTFWGKHEWPNDRKRPLAEAAWTLATSEPHWQRLLRQRGRCFLVVKYSEWAQPRDAYRTRGLQSAPAGMQLVKFRGLDLLWRDEAAGDPHARLLVACDDLLAVPLEHPDARAISYLLRSRLQLHVYDLDAARASLDLAAASVPQSLREWFDRYASTLRETLRLTCERHAAKP